MIEGNRNVISSLEERFESFRDVSYDVGRFMDIVSIKMMNSTSEGAEGSVARTWESIRRKWRTLRSDLKSANIETNITIRNYGRGLYELVDEDISKGEQLEILRAISSVRWKFSLLPRS
ncbi:hypothetical protein SISNIDRAFT_256774 [Sistotremastrum niveocremeum HHB9708]|uniref:Uncharacterized protein n=1 Tax=Sistotremastrum niveocremeum HHB9708 TaxID=1314777 RepID=A0A164PHQ2_9AGAM|nr:hypothetical protein SISNIDRAFT_256774 [Sistotremastrum niveocremeum HHB9708]